MTPPQGIGRKRSNILVSMMTHQYVRQNVGWLVGFYTFGSGAWNIGIPASITLRAALLDAPRSWGDVGRAA